MSRYDLISQILGEVPSILNTYFGMIVSGEQSAIISGLLGLLGLSYIVFKLVKRFWIRLIISGI